MWGLEIALSVKLYFHILSVLWQMWTTCKPRSVVWYQSDYGDDIVWLGGNRMSGAASQTP